MRVSPELLRRLEQAAPRYTSYPTVPEWSSDFGPVDHAAALAEAAKSPEPLSLYVHIPFCQELCSFCGCNVVITRDPARVARYLDAVVAELALTALRLGTRRRLTRIHFGGGTPTFLDEAQLSRLWSAIDQHFVVDGDAEVAIEIDPVVTRPEQLTLLARLGFNRLSMGVQDFDPAVQAAVCRIQSVAETRDAIAHARAVGFRSVNLDMIYGLPHQTPASFGRTMDQVIALQPDRVAVFSFAYLPAARPNQRRLPMAAVPTGADKLALLDVAQARLGGAGYRAIGIDHFALPHDELAVAQAQGQLWRDFQGYSVGRAASTIGIGASAISDLGHAYAQNERALGRYEAAIAAGHQATVKGCWLDGDDRARRDIIVRLMCNGWVDLGPGGTDYFADELHTLAGYERDGLLELDGTTIALTTLGRTFARNVALVFDAYLRRSQPTGFSTTI
jgi:oxygen-independent coproporphyrinogen-3 oxidase